MHKLPIKLCLILYVLRLVLYYLSSDKFIEIKDKNKYVKYILNSVNSLVGLLRDTPFINWVKKDLNLYYITLSALVIGGGFLLFWALGIFWFLVNPLYAEVNLNISIAFIYATILNLIMVIGFYYHEIEEKKDKEKKDKERKNKEKKDKEMKDKDEYKKKNKLVSWVNKAAHLLSPLDKSQFLRIEKEMHKAFTRVIREKSKRDRSSSLYSNLRF